MNGIDPQTWLADVLVRIAELPKGHIDQLLPWNWKALPRRRWQHDALTEIDEYDHFRCKIEGCAR